MVMKFSNQNKYSVTGGSAKSIMSGSTDAYQWQEKETKGKKEWGMVQPKCQEAEIYETNYGKDTKSIKSWQHLKEQVHVMGKVKKEKRVEKWKKKTLWSRLTELWSCSIFLPRTNC